MVAVTEMAVMAALTEAAETEAPMAMTAMAVTGGLMVAMGVMGVMVMAMVATGVMAAATAVVVTAADLVPVHQVLTLLRCLPVCGRRPLRISRHRCPLSRPRMGPGTRRTPGRRIISGNQGLIRSTHARAR